MSLTNHCTDQQKEFQTDRVRWHYRLDGKYFDQEPVRTPVTWRRRQDAIFRPPRPVHRDLLSQAIHEEVRPFMAIFIFVVSADSWFSEIDPISKTYLQICTEFWLNQNNPSTKEFILPSYLQVDALVLLHTYVQVRSAADRKFVPLLTRRAVPAGHVRSVAHLQREFRSHCATLARTTKTGARDICQAPLRLPEAVFLRLALEVRHAPHVAQGTHFDMSDTTIDALTGDWHVAVVHCSLAQIPSRCRPEPDEWSALATQVSTSCRSVKIGRLTTWQAHNIHDTNQATLCNI